MHPAAGLGESCSAWVSILSDVCAALSTLTEPIPATGVAASARVRVLLKFIPLFSGSVSDWLVRPLHAVIRAAVALVAQLKSQDSGAAGLEPGDVHSDLISAVRAAFSACVNQRVSKGEVRRSRKIGALQVAVTLFGMYFKQDALRQCAFFIKAIEGPAFPPLAAFPTSQVVTYKSYTGRLALWEGDFKRANEDLTHAAGRCAVDAGRNRRIIMTALIPVRMALGLLPRPTLTARHGLAVYFDALGEAMRAGDVLAYDAQMEKHAAFFIRAGIYLLLQQLRSIVYRSLLRRICLLHMKLKEGAQIPLPHILHAMRTVARLEVSQHEVECAIANLIFKKYIRGYLSHSPPVLVLAKTGAFPPVRAVAAG